MEELAKTFSPSEYIEGVKKISATAIHDTKQEVQNYRTNYRNFRSNSMSVPIGDKIKFHGRHVPLFGVRMGIVGGKVIYGMGKLGTQTRFGGLATLCIGYGVYKIM
jgi:hypothetical protein